MAMQNQTSPNESSEEARNPFSEPNDKTDIVFVVEGQKLHYYKSLLCISSDVFDKMLEGDFSERNAKEIELPGKRYEDIVQLFKILHPTEACSCKITGTSQIFSIQSIDNFCQF